MTAMRRMMMDDYAPVTFDEEAHVVRREALEEEHQRYAKAVEAALDIDRDLNPEGGVGRLLERLRENAAGHFDALVTTPPTDAVQIAEHQAHIQAYRVTLAFIREIDAEASQAAEELAHADADVVASITEGVTPTKGESA